MSNTVFTVVLLYFFFVGGSILYVFSMWNKAQINNTICQQGIFSHGRSFYKMTLIVSKSTPQTACSPPRSGRGPCLSLGRYWFDPLTPVDIDSLSALPKFGLWPLTLHVVWILPVECEHCLCACAHTPALREPERQGRRAPVAPDPDSGPWAAALQAAPAVSRCPLCFEFISCNTLIYILSFFY